MRKAILGAASAIAFALPAAAADLVVPRYSEAPSYQYRAAPPVVIDEPTPVVAPPPVVVESYPVYAAPPAYASPPTYAYAPPVWREGWGHRGYFHGRW
jgi:opacity protein-like surface antigen